ncbi:unnamed protein product [Allacma fusca]|uniref:Secreted protein n=1 Tax=Allacma fusca TaxID=39272 RepID=A0A8J2JHC5_9HEXA|nr:unnamed protein product [Allacma fusca]
MKIYVLICIDAFLLESSDANAHSFPQHKDRESVRKQNGAVHFQTLKYFLKEENNRMSNDWLPILALKCIEA